MADQTYTLLIELVNPISQWDSDGLGPAATWSLGGVGGNVRRLKLCSL